MDLVEAMISVTIMVFFDLAIQIAVAIVTNFIRGCSTLALRLPLLRIVSWTSVVAIVSNSSFAEQCPLRSLHSLCWPSGC
jgi:hypothetical protein